MVTSARSSGDWTRVGLGLTLSLLVLTSVLGCRSLLTGYAEGRSAELLAWERQAAASGQARFVLDDLGGLNTHTMDSHALPWKVLAASLVIWDTEAQGTEAIERSVGQILQDFGFISPAEIENWSGPLTPPVLDRPLGFVGGQVRRGLPPVSIEVVNLGCASCHAGVTYDAEGQPLPRAWLGLPNSSLDLDRYTRGVYEALSLALKDSDRLMQTVARLFPEVSDRELISLRRYVLPRSRKRMAELATLGAPTVFSGGSPGVTNGVAALKSELGLLDPDVLADEYGFTSIPDLGGRLFRSSLLVDGAYAPRGGDRFSPMTVEEVVPRRAETLAPIAAFFTVPTMGVAPGAVAHSIEPMSEILEFLVRYEAPRFPGKVEKAAARRGSEVYSSRCAECHGRYSSGIEKVRLIEYPNRLSPQEEMRTDATRWQAIDASLVSAIEESKYGGRLSAATTGGYVATLLSGVWATAPYLHNGSVPTLWHLLHPEERPERFEVGGHALDFERVGVAAHRWEYGALRYAVDYEAWSQPQIYDTTQPGRSNLGHEKEFVDLEEGERSDLIEYLKLL